MKASFAFFISLTAFFMGTLGFLAMNDKPKSAVLSARVQSSDNPLTSLVPSLEATDSPFPSILLSPSPTETPIPSQTPSPMPIPTPKKTATPSPSLTPSPTSKPTPSPSPLVSSSPTPTPDVYSPASMTPIFAKYAGQYNVDQNEMERIANCESHFNPNAVNGDYLGMFQFSSSRWISERSQMGVDTSPSLRTNVEESIKTTAFTISKDGSSPWPNCLR